MDKSKIIGILKTIFLDSFKQWRLNYRDYNHLARLFASVNREKIINKTIIINIVRDYKSVIDYEVYYGSLFALYGANVKILIDDGIMEHWDTFQEGYPPKLERIDKVSHNPYYFYKKNKNKISYIFRQAALNKALKTFKVDNMEYLYYSDMIDPKNVSYEDYKEVSKFAESSTIRYFKSSDLDYNNKYIKYFYNLSIRNAILSRNLGKYVLNEFKPDCFITSHGIYSSYGPAYDYLRKNKINCLVFGGVNLHSNFPDSVFFSDTPILLLSRSKFWNAYKNTKVTEEMKGMVEKFFKDRMTFSTPDVKLLFKDGINLYQVDKNDGYKYHIAMFPNIIWDGNIRDRHVVFNDYLDWLISTIKHLKNRNDVKLYIKAHPGEKTFDFFKTTPKICDLIEKKLDMREYPYVEFIPPEKKIDTYQFLMSGIDLALCYDNFLSIEIPYLKIPAIMVVPNGIFSVEEGNYVVKSKEDYFRHLDNIDNLIRDFRENYEKYYINLIRYLFWYLYENVIPSPHINAVREFEHRNFLILREKDITMNEKFLNLFN